MGVQRNDRFFISGRSGGGKSFLARALFEAMSPPRCVVDPKNDTDATGGVYRDRRVAVTFSDPNRIPDAESIRFVPSDPGDDDMWERLYGGLYERRVMFVWTDEASWMFPSRGVGPNVRKLVAQGRVRGSGHIIANQRPVEISPIVASNTEHVVAFDTGNPNDFDTLARMMSISPVQLAAELRRAPLFGFAWYDSRERTLTVCDPIRR